MISPETLRRYPHFAAADDEGLAAIAMFSQMVTVPSDEYVFEEREDAEFFYVLTRGEIDLLVDLGDGRDIVVDTLVAGELVGWSALVPPHTRRLAAVARGDVELIATDAEQLRAFCDANAEFGYKLTRRVVEAVGHRLNGARMQLAAAD